MHQSVKSVFLFVLGLVLTGILSCGPDDITTTTVPVTGLTIDSITLSRSAVTNYGGDSVNLYVALNTRGRKVNYIRANFSDLNLGSMVNLYDNGLSNDVASNDNIYTCIIPTPNVEPGTYSYYLYINYSNNNKLYATNTVQVVGTQLPDLSEFDFPSAVTNTGDLVDISLAATDDGSISQITIDLAPLGLSNGTFTNATGDDYYIGFNVTNGMGDVSFTVTATDNSGASYSTNITVTIYSEVKVYFANGMGYADPHVKLWNSSTTRYIPQSTTLNYNGINYDVYSTYLSDTGSYNVLLQDGSSTSPSDYEEVATLRGTVFRTATVSANQSDIFAATWNRVTFGSLDAITNTLAECPFNLTNMFDSNYKLPGCTKLDSGIYLFSIFVPNQTQVSVTGEFTDWSNPGTNMQFDYRSGYWWTVISNQTTWGQTYKFIAGANNWITDPYCRAVQNGDNNSYIVETNYTWGDGGWVPPTKQELVIYELQVEDFTRDDTNITASLRGTYSGMIEKVDYLVDLGVTAVEIMPIQEWSGGWYSWGYNNSVYFAPEDSLSTNSAIPSAYHDLKAVIDTYHQNGVAVILDVVYNHTANDNNVLWAIDDTYYFDPDGTDWGNKTEWEHKMTQKYFMDNMKYWFDEFHVDGFRFDATQFINFHPLTNAIITFYEQGYSNKIFIMEDFDGWHNDKFQDYNLALGESLFSSWGTPCKEEMWSMVNSASVSGSSTYYSKDSGWNFPTSPINYFSSHDEGALSGRFSANKAQVKTAAAHLLTMMGIPMIWMGDEIMRIHYGNYAPSGSGIDENNNIVHWDTLMAANQDLIQYYSGLIKLRTAHLSLHHNVQDPANTGNFHWNTDWGTTPGLIGYCYKNFSSDNNFVIMVNYATSSRQYNTQFPNTGTWYLMCDGTSATNEAPGLATWTISGTHTNLTIPARTAYIWMSDYVNP